MNSRFEGLQLLRAIAASLVVGFHLCATAQKDPSYSGVFLIFRHGEIGVDLFFVLSGFIIFYTASRKREQGARTFLVHRFFRVFPPYWGILFVTLLVHFLFALWVDDFSQLPTLRALIISVLLLPYPDQIIILAWTLTLEITFYCLFAISYFRFGVWGLLITVGIWAAIGRALLMFGTVPNGLTLIFHSVALEFLYGILIGHLILTGRARGRFAALLLGTVLLIILSAGLLEFGPQSREFNAGVPAALVVYGMTGWKMRIPPLLLLWGDASYILYLMHLLLFSILARLLQVVTHVNSYASDIAMATMFATVIVIACLLCFWLERPYLAWFRRRFTLPDPAA